MVRYSFQPRGQIFVTGYGFLPFVKNMVNNTGKNISKNLSQKLLNNLLQMYLKLTQKEQIKK